MLNITGLYKNFGSLEVLRGVDLSIAQGEVVVLIGPSGTGKSTLLRCINYIEQPQKGVIELDGARLDAENHTRRDIKALREKSSMVFQNYNLFKNKTALENVMAPLVYVQKWEKEKAREAALDLLRQVGLTDKKDEYPSRMSGGQQQRVGIARAMAVNPKVMLFDEPTSSLDPELVGEVLEVIRRLSQKHSRTMLIVTHEMSFARNVADRVVFMDEGRVVEQGPPAQLFGHPQNARTRRFLQMLEGHSQQD